ncbi:phosphoribosylformylglycinamidine synthase subunit PurL [Candidatus Neoehrlichia procyonis]|uniref:Phosphoribosylformylglycinamidine synthase subunit PurL n=1 Tax=Candidatus Neoehrlichia procyonis str. RAC413 TaxID=1359163 RepID=A0A0F3NM64_9RICK|nr:AIR synthase-related protein [Candidatus Neoehrlichia lotoris]KJV69115.1 AIR synthase related, N-terminal domain protein [Candidatus Neoehrlichia lotoris str. RAC413]
MIIYIVIANKLNQICNNINKSACAYVIDADYQFTNNEINFIGKLLSNKVTQEFFAFVYNNNILNYININSQTPYNMFDIFNVSWSIEKAFLPGVTDNVGNTAANIINEAFNNNFKVQVHTSKIFFGSTAIPDMHYISNTYNPLTEYCKLTYIHNHNVQVKFLGTKVITNLNTTLPSTQNSHYPIPYIKYTDLFTTHKKLQYVHSIDLNVSDDNLMKISKYGINGQGSLNLSLRAMKSIQKYFQKINRHPNDIEIEALAQTWSEHCKHNIFSSPIDEISDGLYKHYIKRATAKINSPICVSVFSDNAGAIVFDDNFIIVDKVETHNSPSALDPFGGAITGILGVNRDIIGFGKGAKPILNSYYFCFAESIKEQLYRDSQCSTPILHPTIIMDEVVRGVNIGGNCSGIPTALGSVYFDNRFYGKPLVFVGTTGIIPRTIQESPSHLKSPMNGDYIVIIGGRTGKDGIHGATFSSNILTENISSTVVQIGDPITQKKLSDAIIKEARDLNLYNAITDNGAGGLSSSIGEMGIKGFIVNLNKVLLKHPYMLPWEIWISESQERMTLAVPPDKYHKLEKIMQKHNVEISIIGEFTNTNKAIVLYDGRVIMDLDIDFLHNGNPVTHLTTQPRKCPLPITQSNINSSIEEDLHNIIQRVNINSKEFISVQYDHEVQGSSVIKPIQGKGRVCGDAIVIRPILSSKKGIVKSHGFGSRYGDVDSYNMAACAIDSAIRNYVAVGGNFDHLALIDNFCWCDSTNPERLWQLKEAARGCYDYAVAFNIPFISGKDSMFNDFKGYDSQGNPIHISSPPSLLISTLGIIDNIEHAVTLDVKAPNDLIYVLGVTYNELGMSEYQAYSNVGEVNIPQVNTKAASTLYKKFYQAINNNIIASSIALNLGGLIVGLIKSLIGGQLGAKIDLSLVPTQNINFNNKLKERIIMFSESQSRILVTINRNNKKQFEKIFQDVPHAVIGTVTSTKSLCITGLTSIAIDDLEVSYKKFSNQQLYKANT